MLTSLEAQLPLRVVGLSIFSCALQGVAIPSMRGAPVCLPPPKGYRLRGKVQFDPGPLTQASMKKVYRKVFVVGYPVFCPVKKAFAVSTEYKPSEEYIDQQLNERSGLRSPLTPEPVTTWKTEWHTLDSYAHYICYYGSRTNEVSGMLELPDFILRVPSNLDHCRLCDKQASPPHLGTFGQGTEDISCALTAGIH